MIFALQVLWPEKFAFDNANDLKEQPFYAFLAKTYWWHITAQFLTLWYLGGLPAMVWLGCLRVCPPGLSTRWCNLSCKECIRDISTIHADYHEIGGAHQAPCGTILGIISALSWREFACPAIPSACRAMLSQPAAGNSVFRCRGGCDIVHQTSCCVYTHAAPQQQWHCFHALAQYTTPALQQLLKLSFVCRLW